MTASAVHTHRLSAGISFKCKVNGAPEEISLRQAIETAQGGYRESNKLD
jgi:hypothetical protein